MQLSWVGSRTIVASALVAALAACASPARAPQAVAVSSPRTAQAPVPPAAPSGTAAPSRAPATPEAQFKGMLDSGRMMSGLGDGQIARSLLQGASIIAMQPPLTAEHQAQAYEALGDLDARAGAREQSGQAYGAGIDALSLAGMTHLPIYQRLLAKFGSGRLTGRQAIARHFETASDGTLLHKPSSTRFPLALGSWARQDVLPYSRDSFEVLGRYARTVDGKQQKLAIATYAAVREQPEEIIKATVARPGAREAGGIASGPLSLSQAGLAWGGHYGIAWRPAIGSQPPSAEGRYLYRNGDITVSFRAQLPGGDRDAVTMALNEAVQRFAFPTIGTLKDPFKGPPPEPTLSHPWAAEPLFIH